MKCKNCGQFVGSTFILEETAKQLKDQIAELEERIQSIKNGFCDSYCENNYHGEF